MCYLHKECDKSTSDGCDFSFLYISRDISGFISIMFLPLHPQTSLERTSECDERLSRVCEEAERLQLHLPKAGAAQVQEHLSSCHRGWKNFLESCSQSQRDLEESIDLLKK